MCTYASFSRKLFRIRTYKKHPGWEHFSLPTRIKMKSKTAKSVVLSVRCAYRTSDGRQCRLSVTDAHSGLCPQHRAAQIQTEAADHYKHLTTSFQCFQTAQGVNFSLMNLYQLLAQNRISPRGAAVLAYISSLLLRTLPQIDPDKDAGIIDPTKPIDVSVADEAADPDEDSDEDSDLDPDEDAVTDSETEIGTETDTATATVTRLDSTNTWDPSIPEPDPKKKPS